MASGRTAPTMRADRMKRSRCATQGLKLQGFLPPPSNHTRRHRRRPDGDQKRNGRLGNSRGIGVQRRDGPGLVPQSGGCRSADGAPVAGVGIRTVSRLYPAGLVARTHDPASVDIVVVNPRAAMMADRMMTMPDGVHCVGLMAMGARRPLAHVGRRYRRRVAVNGDDVRPRRDAERQNHGNSERAQSLECESSTARQGGNAQGGEKTPNSIPPLARHLRCPTPCAGMLFRLLAAPATVHL